ncbi:MAG: ADP-L-glycero-D-manno-heptose 6-epimerase [Limisphaerales bacterium]|jgi:ADP-L-glycero-D-manno-heptose 6-epimerase
MANPLDSEPKSDDLSGQNGRIKNGQNFKHPMNENLAFKLDQNPEYTVIITGAAGFIGSVLSGWLAAHTNYKLILVDDFSSQEKLARVQVRSQATYIDRAEFQDWFSSNPNADILFHLGARTDTLEQDKAIFDLLNLNYSKAIWNICAKANIPMIYASSAATYGAGDQGYQDKHSTIRLLKPLNPYGDSKQNFDCWVLDQIEKQPPFWAGLKFFNVYGPNEGHKSRMASVVLHAWKQIKATGKMKLFKSHRDDIKHGEQQRDFVFVFDVVMVLCWLMGQAQEASKFQNGIYNLGSGKANTFLDLVSAVFEALELPSDISFIDTPEAIRAHYQYYTKAEMQKLIKAGFPDQFTSLSEGVKVYVQDYLEQNRYY